MRMIEFSLLWIFIIVVKIVEINLSTDSQLTTNIRRRFFGSYSSPAIGDIYVHMTPSWVKLSPVYILQIG